MLKDLSIQNLLLMESCHLTWDAGMHVITGETGSGKTAILHAIKLLLGQKLDVSLIRKGASKAFVQARFELSFPKDLQTLLDETGISYEDSCLILSREISLEGKSKSWINERSVSLSFLQKVGSYCIQIVDQHSSEELRHSDTQRKLLDSFASLERQIKEFSLLLEEKHLLQKRQEELLERERKRERERPLYETQIEELKKTSITQEEEERLFQEYVQANHAEEISETIDKLFFLLSQSPNSLSSQVKQAETLCKPHLSLHKTFEESFALLQNITVSLQEISHLLRSAISYFDPDPQKKDLLESKLSAIDKAKKKYGNSFEEREKYRLFAENELKLFATIEEEKILCEESFFNTEKALQDLAGAISSKRKEAAVFLQEKLTKEIQSLNMKEASVRICVEPHARTFSGEDQIHFWLAANRGEKPGLVKESSSGGELARLLLAVKLCLAEKNETPTLIFDEIDAGVGGETARLIGEKLQNLSLLRQIVCISHFPQVACYAHTHWKVEKVVEGDRTFAHISSLDSLAKEKELLRMLGGKKTLSFYDGAS